MFVREEDADEEEEERRKSYLEGHYFVGYLTYAISKHFKWPVFCGCTGI